MARGWAASIDRSTSLGWRLWPALISSALPLVLVATTALKLPPSHWRATRVSTKTRWDRLVRFMVRTD